MRTNSCNVRSLLRFSLRAAPLNRGSAGCEFDTSRAVFYPAAEYYLVRMLGCHFVPFHFVIEALLLPRLNQRLFAVKGFI
jgi:hypothetical protein